MNNNRFLLVTVGSTRFDDLIDEITVENLEGFIEKFNLDRIIIQHGKSNRPQLDSLEDRVVVQNYFEPEQMSVFVELANVIISHGGAGTIFEVLRYQKNLESFFVVVNDGLMDSHQSELIDTLLEEMNCPIIKTSCNNLFKHDKKVDLFRNFRLPPINNDILINLLRE